MKAIWSKIKELILSLFGRLEWTRPDWLAYLRDGDEKHNPSKLTRRLRSFSLHLRALPRRTKAGLAVRRNRKIAIVSLLLILIFANVAVFFLYSRKLELPKLTYTITPLRATPLQERAKPYPLEINFSQSAAKLQQVDKPISGGITMVPAVQGDWRWINDTYLTFTPAQDWPVNTEYRVRFDQAFFPDGVIPDQYESTFRSAPFEMTIEKVEFYINPEDSTDKRVVATVRFSHPVEAAGFEKRAHFTLLGQVVPKTEEDFSFTVNYDNWRGKAFLTTVNIPTPRFPKEMKLTIEDGVRAAAGGNRIDSPREEQVSVPGIYDYLYITESDFTYAANEQYVNEQILLLSTTVGVQAEELNKYLQVWLLPVNKPAAPDGEEEKDFYWSDPEIIGPEILAKSQPLTLEPVPAAEDYSLRNGFRFSAPPGRFIYVRIKQELPSFGGYLLGKEYASILRIPPYPTLVRIMHNGSILSVSGDRKLSVISTGYKYLSFSLARVLPEEINHLLSQSEGDIRSPHFANYRFNEENISEIFSQERDLSQADQTKPQFTGFDFSDYLGSEQYPINHGLFILRIKGSNAQESRPESAAEGDDGDEGDGGYGGESRGYGDRRLILLTDLGLIEKKTQSGEHYVFVQSFATGLPVAGAAVSVIGKNGVALFEHPTDHNGLAVFPHLDDFQAERKPVAFIARLGADISFLPYHNSSRSLNYYRFDVGGLRTESEQGRLRAFLFSVVSL